MWTLIKSDLFRLSGSVSLIVFMEFYWLSPGFKYMCWHRIAHYAHKKGRLCSLFPKLLLRHFSYKFGFDIPAETIIGKGFYIGHFGGIVISPKAIIGNNCNISQNVTIGLSSRGPRKGYPTIGEMVYIGPGAKIIGNIQIGNNVAIGANAVVCNDVPDNAVVVGIPARIISYKRSEGYILNKIQ
jgi:serine O-acetyltransferase